MIRALQIFSFWMALSLGAPLYAKDARQFQVKADTLETLRTMRDQNVKRLKEIDETMRARMEDSGPATIEFEVSRLRTAKREHSLRQEFLDRLIFQVDTRFSGSDLRAFLERALTEMAKTDASLTTAHNDGGLWKFLKFSADAVRRLPDQKENILTFLEGYMNRSVANPIRPEDYLNTRNYSNGLASESGLPMARDEVGAVVDSRIKDGQDEPAPAAPAAPPAN